MGIKKFPDKDTPEFQNIKTSWENGESLISLSQRYHMSPSGMKDQLSKQGIKRQFTPQQMQKVEPQPILLPPVEIQKYTPLKGRRGDPETQILLLGDHHAGEITPTCNPTVYKQRRKNLFKTTMRITDLHRHMYPINDLVIMMVGDMVHGENVYQGANVETIACGAQEQIYEIALPELLSLILSFKENFRTIKIYAVRGNHGRYSPIAPRTSNWDIILYKALRDALTHYDIEMNVSNDFCQMVVVQGFKIFAFHGDQFRANQGIPYFAMSRKIKDWYFSYGPFDYTVCGHWHKDDFYRISSKVKAFINGAIPTDDPFALEIVGTSTIPTQWTFGMHERHGITWTYSLVLDPKFLPQKDIK